MLDNLFNSFEITPSQKKIFAITFVAVSVMVFLQHAGVHSPIPAISLDK